MHLVSEKAVVGVGGLALLPRRVVHHPLDLVRGHRADTHVRVSEVGAQLQQFCCGNIGFLCLMACKLKWLVLVSGHRYH